MNAQAADLILRDRDRYAGLPVFWAELWLQKNGLTTPQTSSQPHHPSFTRKEQTGETVERMILSAKR